MLRYLLPIALLVAGCSKGGHADLPYIGEARSLAAEWALVNDEMARAISPAIMSPPCATAFASELKTTATSLTGRTRLMAARSRRFCAARRCRARSLRARSDKLKQSRTGLNPLEMTLGIMTAVGGFVDISELVFAAQAGSTFGYALIWVFALSTIGIIVFSAR